MTVSLQNSGIVANIRKGIAEIHDWQSKRNEIRSRIDTVHAEQVKRFEEDEAKLAVELAELEAILDALNLPHDEPVPLPG